MNKRAKQNAYRYSHLAEQSFILVLVNKLHHLICPSLRLLGPLWAHPRARRRPWTT